MLLFVIIFNNCYFSWLPSAFSFPPTDRNFSGQVKSSALRARSKIICGTDYVQLCVRYFAYSVYLSLFHLFRSPPFTVINTIFCLPFFCLYYQLPTTDYRLPDTNYQLMTICYRCAETLFLFCLFGRLVVAFVPPIMTGSKQQQ